MKKTWMYLIVILLFALVAGCGPKEPAVDTNMVYTQAAQTVGAQLTAAYTPPPTEEPTQTPEPTATVTVTPPPSPTPTEAWAAFPAGSAKVPILLYTHIAAGLEDNIYYQHESPLNIDPEVFRQQMQVLKQAGYTSIPVSLVSQILVSGGNLPPRPVVITFDGNTAGLYTKAFPIMKEMGFTGVLYLVSSQLDGKGALSSAQVKEMVAAGWEVGSKGMTGVDLTKAENTKKWSDEISSSRLDLEKKLEVPVTSFAYPGNGFNGEIADRVSRWGYTNAVGIGKTSDHERWTSLFYLPRYEITNKLTLEDFVSYLPWKPDTMPVVSATTPEAGTMPTVEGAVEEPVTQPTTDPALAQPTQDPAVQPTTGTDQSQTPAQ